jgi:hypothetical protein
MTQSPRPLFRSFTLDGGRPKAPPTPPRGQLAGGS